MSVSFLLSSPLLERHQRLFFLYFTTPRSSRDVCVFAVCTSFPASAPKIMGYLATGQVPMKKQQYTHSTHESESTQRARKRAAASPTHLPPFASPAVFFWTHCCMFLFVRSPSSFFFPFSLFCSVPFPPFPFPFSTLSLFAFFLCRFYCVFAMRCLFPLFYCILLLMAALDQH